MRAFLTLILFFSVAATHTSHIDLEKRTHSSTGPNVILVIADQMRGDALGVMGHPLVKSPNIDRLASRGVLFTHYFVNNPVCVPSRMSMFSGKYPHEHGALSNKGSLTGQRHVRLSSPDSTLLGYFTSRGYRLGWFGKDNHTYRRSVLDSLLDGNTSRRREAFRAYANHTPPHWYGASPWPNEQLYASQTTTDALDFIKQPSESPFFVVLSLFDPHPPYFAPAEYVANYPLNRIQIPERIDPQELGERLADHKRALLYDELTDYDLKAAMAHYYAAIEWGVDHQVGRILDVIDEQNLTEETIIVFTSEHGDFMGDYGMVRKGMFLYDALLHVPFIWHAPGRIEEGIQTSALSQSVDLMPTLIELTEGDATAYQGRSLVPLLKGQADWKDDRTIFASAAYSTLPNEYFDSPERPYYSPLQDETKAFHSRVFDRMTSPTARLAMARTKNWKLIISDTHPPELYHLHGERIEKKNVALHPQNRGVLSELKAELDAHWTW